MSRSFHLGDILSVTTGRVYEILNYMTGENLMTHQLPRAALECAGPLLAQHPILSTIAVPADFGPDQDREKNVRAWLAVQVARYGETREVEPLSPQEHTSVDPLAELRKMAPGKPVVIISAEGGES